MKRSRLLFLAAIGLILALVALLPGSNSVLAGPTLLSVSPNEAGQGQSLSVTILGDNFTDNSTVSFGSQITVSGFSVDNATQATANITIDIDAALGARDVTVTAADNTTGTLVGGFTVLARPIIDWVNPVYGYQGQTANVTITGSDFTANATVSFGSGVTVNGVTDPVPALQQIQVGTGTSSTDYPFSTFWEDRRTQSILLASEIGQAGEIQKISLYCSSRPGRDLEDFYIRMQHTTMTSFSSTAFVNSGWITTLQATNVDVDTWSVPGWIEFELTTPFVYNGTSNLLIDYCMDNTYWSGSGLCRYTSTATYRTLTYYADLGSGNALNMTWGTRQSWHNNVVLVMESMDQITANITIDGAAAPGTRNVTVTTATGTDNLTDGFTVLPPPTISSVSPDEGTQGQTLGTVTITGTDLLGVEDVDFGDEITVNSYSVDNATQITASITIGSSAIVGTRDVSIIYGTGTDTLSNGFTVNQAPPNIVSVSPDEGVQGRTLQVTISGDYFTGDTSVSFGSGITVNGVTLDDVTQISANITISPTATVGTRTVSVTNTAGTDNLTDGFTIKQAPPTISLISPNQGLQGQTLDVTISGTYLTGVTSVNFGYGIDVIQVNTNSEGIVAKIRISDTTAAGPRDVSVTTPGGTAIKGWGFTVLAPPAIDSVSPSQGGQGQTLDVSISGSYFAGDASVSFGSGITVNTVDVEGSALILANITIDGSAALGARDVTVTTPGGTTTKADCFTVLAMPSISAVSPSVGAQGQRLEVTITGSDLGEVTSVSFGPGITVNSLTVDSPTQLTVEITIRSTATIGDRTVSVGTPVGSESLPGGFAVAIPAPIIDELSLVSGRQGETFELIITGSLFKDATEVSLGEGITVNSFTVDSDTQITAEVTIAGNAATGPRDVTVITPETSGTLTDAFTVKGSAGVPLYVWLLTGLAAAAILTLLVFFIRRRRAAH